ncbi:MAG TPA: serine/threonine-protein kinase [Polyangiaceae bacterium]|nr:serine/threonine-protein kinase [Polyangiaceae bacterium]
MRPSPFPVSSASESLTLPLRAALAVLLGAVAIRCACALGVWDPSRIVATVWPNASTAACGALALAVVVLLSASRRHPPAPRAGQYALSEKIGEGGMGVVYKGSHPLLERPVAIKLLPPERASRENVQRFQREVQRTSRLTHPNTISVYDFGRTRQGLFFYAMEYVDGLDLQTLVERHGALEPSRVAHILSQLAGALGEAHAAGLIHGDVKPANIMLCERGGMLDVVKVLDFGLSQALDGQAMSRCDSQRLLGTPLYLSPEALTAPESLDARSDLYALGAVGYFLLTGMPPFSGESVLEVCGRHLHDAPTSPSQRTTTPIPRELEALVMSCLSKSPSHRPASAASLQAELAPSAAGWNQARAERWWSARKAASPVSSSHRAQPAAFSTPNQAPSFVPAAACAA